MISLKSREKVPCNLKIQATIFNCGQGKQSFYRSRLLDALIFSFIRLKGFRRPLIFLFLQLFYKWAQNKYPFKSEKYGRIQYQ